MYTKAHAHTQKSLLIVFIKSWTINIILVVNCFRMPGRRHVSFRSNCIVGTISSCHIDKKTKSSQPLLNVWSCVFWEKRTNYLSNCIVGTCMAFLQCEWGGGFSNCSLGWMTSRTLYTDLASLQSGWVDVWSNLILWLRSSRTICIDLAFLRNVFSCDL